MKLWSKRRGHLQTLRVIALVPLAVAHLIAWDLVLRLAIATRNERWIHAVIGRTVRGMNYLLRAGLNWQFRLDPRLASLADQPGGTIVVANHHSPLDMQVLMHALAGTPTHFVCRPGLERRLPFISLYVRYACAILTADPQKNDARISHLGKRVAASNGVAVIFPEGRKSAKNYADILPFMPSGLDRLVAAAPSARVVAVAIKGTHAAWPAAWQLPKPDALIEVMVADPVQTEQARQTTRSRQCEDAIRQVLNLEPNAPRRPDTSWT